MKIGNVIGIAISALLLAGEAAAMTETERWDLEEGHSIVFVEDELGAFGVYEILEEGKHASVLGTEVPSTPETPDALYESVLARLEAVGTSAMLAAPGSAGPSEDVEDVGADDPTYFNDPFEAWNWETTYCSSMHTEDKSGCSAWSNYADSGFVYVTQLKLATKAPGPAGSDFLLYYKNRQENAWTELLDVDLVQGQIVTFEFIPPNGAQAAEVNVIVGSNDPAENVFLAYGYTEAFVQSTNFNTEYPAGVEHWWTEMIQGVAHDSSYWYFTNTAVEDTVTGDRLANKVAKADRGTDLGGSQPILMSAALPQSIWDLGYFHLGDPDVYNGYVLVPVEDGNNGNKNGIVVAYNASNLSYVGYAELSREKAPWAAVNPVDGKLYSSPYYDDNSTVVVDRYTVRFSPTFTLIYYDSITLDHQHKMIQGGAFSPSGRFYLVSDSEDSAAGIYGYSMPSGRQRSFRFIDYAPTTTDQELEGLTIVDVDGQGAPNIDGQFHVVMLDKDPVLTGDDFYFKHYDVSVDWDKGML